MSAPARQRLRHAAAALVALSAVTMLLVGIEPGGSTGGTWTLGNTGLGSTSLSTIIDDGTRFVGVGTSGAGGVGVGTSPDGTTWTAVTQTNGTIVNNATPTALAFDGTTYALVTTSLGATGTNIWTSTDLVNWTSTLSSAVTLNIRGLCFCNGQFVAVGEEQSTQKIWTSATGASWSASSLSPVVGTLTGITYLDGAYRSSTTQALNWSTDLSTWTSWSPALPGTWDRIQYVPYQGDLYAFTISNAAARLFTSTDGTNWTDATSDLPSSPTTALDCAVSFGTSMLVHTFNGWFLTDDGTTWTAQTLAFAGGNPACGPFVDNGTDLLAFAFPGQGFSSLTYATPPTTTTTTVPPTTTTTVPPTTTTTVPPTTGPSLGPVPSGTARMTLSDGSVVTVPVRAVPGGFLVGDEPFQILVDLGPGAQRTPDGRIVVTARAAVRTSGTGFLPGGTIEIWCSSDPTRIGTTTVDGGGAFSTSDPLPSDLGAGDHTLEVRGQDTSGAPRAIAVGFTLAGSALPSTGTESSTPTAIGVVALLAGVGLLLLARRRPAH